MSKNVWYINHYSGGPGLGRAYRPYYFGREWMELGYDVTIICANRHHLLMTEECSPGISDIAGVRYLFIPTSEYKGNGISRLINMFSFFHRLFKDPVTEYETKAPDVIIYSSPHPFGYFAARKLARRYKAKLIYEIRDLWPLSLSELLGISKRHPFWILCNYVENFACKTADAVVSSLSHSYKYLNRHCDVQSKFTWIPNTIDEQDIKKDHPEPLSEEEQALPLFQDLMRFQSEGRFVLVYAGGHGLPNALSSLIEAMSVLGSDIAENIELVLVGGGDQKGVLTKRAVELGLNHVHFYPPVSRTAITHVLAVADAAFIGWQKKELYKYGISPNKLMHYMGMGLPVIHAVETSLDPVAESGCGISVKPEDSREIATAVVSLSQKSKEELQQMGKAGRDYVLKNYNNRVVAKSYVDLF